MPRETVPERYIPLETCIYWCIATARSGRTGLGFTPVSQPQQLPPCVAFGDEARECWPWCGGGILQSLASACLSCDTRGRYRAWPLRA
jgi:hypothetical protein